jgi:hypothetical protein
MIKVILLPTIIVAGTHFILFKYDRIKYSQIFKNKTNKSIVNLEKELNEKMNPPIQEMISDSKIKDSKTFKKNIKFIFSHTSLFGFNKVLNATSCPGRIVTIDFEWSKILDNTKYYNAFIFVIGHEIGHKMNEPKEKTIKKKKLNKKERIFYNWIIECRADFIGMKFAQKYFNINKEDLLESTKSWDKYCINKDFILKTRFKNFYLKLKKKGHPNWCFRETLMNNYNEFNEIVIRKIAEELDFEDENFIQKIIKEASLNNIF